MKCYSYSNTKLSPMAMEETAQNLEEKRVPLGIWSGLKGYKLSVSDSLHLDIINRLMLKFKIGWVDLFLSITQHFPSST